MTTVDPLAQAAMVAYCGWDPTFVFTGTKNIDGNGTSLLPLPTLHLTEVSEVVVTDHWGGTCSRTIGMGEDCTWSENGLLLWQSPEGGGVWPEGQGNVAVTYTGGYRFAPVDLRAALNSLSRRIGGPTFGATSARMGTASVAFGQQIATGGLLMVEQMVFDRYRIPRSA